MTLYLDHHATTPCDPRVLEAMLPYFTGQFGNPSSAYHLPGRTAAKALDTAREQVAALLNAQPQEIIFTSGATESNNLAILGLTQTLPPQRRRIVTTRIEHKAVLEPCRVLAERGFEVVYLPLERDGRVRVDEALELIDDQTLLVSIQSANSEVGTLQPLEPLFAHAKDQGAYTHCDATQSVGHLAIDIQTLPVDLLSLSGHKLYAPKGCGALFMRRSSPRIPLKPLMFGGAQEGHLRPGTENVPYLVGLGLACVLAGQEMVGATHLRDLRDALERGLKEAIPEIRFNGSRQHRLPGNSSVTLPGVEADALLLNLPEIALSIGSACNSGAMEPSYVLTALGLTREEADQTFRVGLGRTTQRLDVEMAVQQITSAYLRLI